MWLSSATQVWNDTLPHADLDFMIVGAHPDEKYDLEKMEVGFEQEFDWEDQLLPPLVWPLDCFLL